MLDQESFAEEFDLEDEEINEALRQEEEQELQEPEPKESQPPTKMHISEADWIKQGRDPAKWVAPELFAETTRRINETSKLKQENARLRAEREEDARRLTNVAFLQQQQIARLREQLEDKKTDAIYTGNEADVRKIDRQLKDLDTEESLIREPVQAVQQVAIPAAVSEWNQRNEWLTADHPLKPLANDIYAQAIEDGETVRAALKLVDSELSRHRGEPKKTPPKSMVDSPSRGAVSRSDSVSLKMSDLTREEKDSYNEFWKPSGSTEKEFLKYVAENHRGKQP